MNNQEQSIEHLTGPELTPEFELFTKIDQLSKQDQIDQQRISWLVKTAQKCAKLAPNEREPEIKLALKNFPASLS
jgi:hypothetical protein